MQACVVVGVQDSKKTNGLALARGSTHNGRSVSRCVRARLGPPRRCRPNRSRHSRRGAAFACDVLLGGRYSAERLGGEVRSSAWSGPSAVLQRCSDLVREPPRATSSAKSLVRASYPRGCPCVRA
ncbi:hypothetical protein MTO96_008912 [Rhipicephalus appendiculatus]